MDKRTGKKKKKQIIRPEAQDAAVPSQKVPVILPIKKNTTNP
jgi:hypothetical protein